MSKQALTSSSLLSLAVMALALLVAVFVFDGCPRYGAREAARRMQCSNNLHNIALALQDYRDDHGSFPPAYVADAAGKPIHSWRVLLLPYLDQEDLYAKYSFDEPWDGPNNSKLHDKILKIFLCPSRSEKHPRTETAYVAVVGPETMWPDDKATKTSEIKDGVSNTIAIVEVRDSGIHWMEPRDLHTSQMPMLLNTQRGQGISSGHPNGAQVALADGSVRWLNNKLPPETLRALLTIFGRETIGDF